MKFFSYFQPPNMKIFEKRNFSKFSIKNSFHSEIIKDKKFGMILFSNNSIPLNELSKFEERFVHQYQQFNKKRFEINRTSFNYFAGE